MKIVINCENKYESDTLINYLNKSKIYHVFDVNNESGSYLLNSIIIFDEIEIIQYLYGIQYKKIKNKVYLYCTKDIYNTLFKKFGEIEKINAIAYIRKNKLKSIL